MCPTDGGTTSNQRQITIVGSKFSGNPLVTVNGKRADVVGSNDTCIVASLPDSAGIKSTVIVTCNTSLFTTSDRLDYIGPNITDVQPNTNLFRNNSGFPPNLLTITGTNFALAGGNVPTVLVGTESCTGVSLFLTTGVFQSITCAYPSGTASSRSVSLFQSGGLAIVSDRTVSYAQCPNGTKLANLACVDCPAGTFSPTQSQTSCFPCAAGKISERPSGSPLAILACRAHIVINRVTFPAQIVRPEDSMLRQLPQVNAQTA